MNNQRARKRDLLHNQPSNDICREVQGGYLDVVWHGRNRTWRAVVCGERLGFWPTRRRAKKAAIAKATGAEKTAAT